MKVRMFFGVGAVCTAVLIAAALDWSENPGFAQTGQEKDITEQVLKDIEAGKSMVLRYDNCRATIRGDIKGDAGSRSSITAQLDGLYVICEPVLTHSKTRNGPVSPSSCDLYSIYPQRLTISTYGQETYYTEPGMTTTNTWKKTRTVSLPEPPSGTLSHNDVEKYHNTIRQWHKANGIIAKLLVVDRRPMGGNTIVLPSVYTSDPKGLTSRTTYSDGSITTVQLPLVHALLPNPPGPAPANAPAPASAGYVHWRNLFRTEVKGEVEDFSLLDLSIQRRTNATGPAERSGLHPKNDKIATADIFYSVGISKEVDATLKPESADEAQYLPTPGEQRRYRLTIKSPPISEVEAIRIKLSDVTTYPGIATNAGAHILCPGHKCNHCNTGWKMSTSTQEQSFSDMSFPRMVTTYNSCPIDRMPDLYFIEDDNRDFELDGKIIEGSDLKYRAGLELLKKAPDKEEYTITVQVMDGAASGRLSAELLVGGAWCPAVAEGQTASKDQLSLQIPLDANSNGIADAWEPSRGTNPMEDNDNSTGSSILGDGLTLKEEYRGIYEGLSFRRTEPDQQDLFVTDDSGIFGATLANGVKAAYLKSGIYLRILRCYEFRHDIVNWTASDLRRHPQYLIVVMQHMTMPLGNDAAVNREWIDMWQEAYGGWAVPSWPCQQHHTVFIRSGLSGPATETFVIAHEIGHQMNLKHHGDNDEIIEITDQKIGQTDLNGKYYVAVRGGEHSGNHECFMRYSCANLFCDDTSVRQPFSLFKSRYKIFTPVTENKRDLFCKTKAGTGFNANGNWCSDATNGPCRPNLRIRSE